MTRIGGLQLIDLLGEGDSRRGVNEHDLKTAISGITCDSRRVEKGFLFAALPGMRLDGRTFIADAVERGAAAILTSEPVASLHALADAQGVAVITDPQPRRRLAHMAARFFAAQPASVAAVTGTNGKTSVVWFLNQIWTRLGHRSGCLGTLGLMTPGDWQPGNLTTPDPVELHRMLASLAREGIDHLAMEASSHGISQNRLDGVRIAAGAFTNLSRDHLDYHGSLDAYLKAKMRLFSELIADGGAAVLCADDPSAPKIEQEARRRLRVVTYGRSGADLRLVDLQRKTDGQRLSVVLDGKTHEIEVPLVGDFQALNALCAAALAWTMGADGSQALQALERLQAVPGRLENVGSRDSGAAVYVDYAHTPDALQAALTALRPFATGRLFVVFGCGGDRDAGKRPEMGRIAAACADQIYITDDNPRSEAPSIIRRQILAACPGAGEIADRAEAIRVAADSLGSGDILLIAGKGHETGQLVGDTRLPFDDREVAKAVLKELA
ncbi:MAG: UDP-N-acetylmuramoyl-L-alanyl-D-glutamate--2,6-diaminopimelate ligase [Hyphomicrobiales bacterium]|nr:UDP-N-acetylmuramoyl-L-alanyl-D-glutamate--2,6-diaminopimelate ligase [Hyphomicrobiales bacterium]